MKEYRCTIENPTEGRQTVATRIEQYLRRNPKTTNLLVPVYIDIEDRRVEWGLRVSDAFLNW